MSQSLPSNLVSKENLENYLQGLSESECEEVEDEFNAWYNPQGDINALFVEFIEEVHMHTYCNVCAMNYHDDDPCIWH